MGRFDEARFFASRAIDILQDLGLRFDVALEAEVSGVIEALAGDEEASERVFRASVEALMEMGDTGGLSSVAALLAKSLYKQGRFSEAAHFARLSRDNSQDDDIDPQVRWRSVSAQVLAQQGHGEEAETLAREAVVLAEAAEFPILQADALTTLASVLTAVGRSEQAVGFVDQGACPL